MSIVKYLEVLMNETIMPTFVVFFSYFLLAAFICVCFILCKSIFELILDKQKGE